jgi:single-strand DNA-binding protein
MSSDFNRVILMGRLTRDPELRYTPNGKAVVSFSIATNRRYRGGGEEVQEETTFIDCEGWSKQAETIAQYLTKGQPIFVEGRLKLDQWESPEGSKRSKLKVVVERFQFVGAPREGAPAGEVESADLDENE